ncbi:hypothetical protein O181_084139 [Austropuccinia psidii MF-1]|uniref:Acetyl-coenzyme A transporter 1 n=1 Tax=Austropuccinia psidii MF-1 TaxID=1389203 RepID=A0A9Q3FSJ4_9BASI|nr:hypothetical protein [Austropuccinia psidii MF-1]
MSNLSSNRFAVLDTNQPEINNHSSQKNLKKKISKSFDKNQIQSNLNSNSNSDSKNSPTQVKSSSIKMSEIDKIGLRERSHIPLLSNDDLLEMGSQNNLKYSFKEKKNSNSKNSKSKSKNTLENSKKLFQIQDSIPSTSLNQMSLKDKQAIILLVILYWLQGIPLGLALGSVPFLLASRLSYSQIGLFSLASYPYSLKLLWSPIVDSCYFTKIGRRKSWIIPVQALIGLTLWWMSNHIDTLINAQVPDVKALTFLFFTLVLFAATQDIAVDGWALELLSKENLSYASTSQTIGTNIGYFLSFTVFLAFNSIEFSNNRWRPLFGFVSQDYPLITLSGYLRFAALCFILVTLYLIFIQTEDPVDSNSPESDMDIKQAYQIMYEICKLNHVQSFIFIHCIAKLGISVNDAATSLKLLEKGLSKEDMALSVLIDFPFQILLGYFAAKWTSGPRPLQPWLSAMWFRLLCAVWSVGLVYYFPQTKPLATSYFIVVIASTVLTSFASTTQFVGIAAFHSQIADPLIGGSYMTLLNTFSNLGGTWPRYFVLKGVDFFTEASCLIPNANVTQASAHGNECVSELGKAKCKELNGDCHTFRDGYYIMQAFCITLGVFLLMFFVRPISNRLEVVPPRAWQVRKGFKS